MSNQSVEHMGWKRGSLVKVKATGKRGRVIRCSIPGSKNHRYDVMMSETMNPPQPVPMIDAGHEELELIQE